MAGLTLKLLGGFQAFDEHGQPIAVTAKKSAAMLAYLALQSGFTTTRDKLTGLLWGESGETQARASLRQALSSLRKILPDGVLEADHQHVVLTAEPLRVDAVRFLELGASGSTGELERAARLYEGDLLDGFFARADGFDEWLLFERERVRERAVATMSDLLDRLAEVGDAEVGIRTAVRLLTLDPLQERVHRRLMKLYARSGRRGSALRQFRLCRDLLERELGARPSASTRALYAEILESPEPDRTAEHTVVAPPDPDEGDEHDLVDEGPPSPQLRHVTAVVVGLVPPRVDDPEALHRALSAGLTAVTTSVERYGGQVTKRMGDTVMAVFGVPAARSRDTELAVRAALDVHARVGATGPVGPIGPTARVGEATPLAAQIGVASGQVMVVPGAEGAPPNVFGGAVSVAAGLQTRAAVGATLAASGVRRGTEAAIDYEPVPSGLGDDTGDWRAVGIRDQTLGSRDEPFVGRDVELQLLCDSLRHILDGGRGRSVLVRGEAGIGKTRLVAQAAREASDLGYAVHLGRILDFGVGSPEEAVRSLVVGVLGLTSGAHHDDLEHAIAEARREGLIGRRGQAWLNDLLGVSQPAELLGLVDAADGPAAARARRDVVASLVREASQSSPRLLVVEDIHWADDETVRHLLALIEVVATTQAMLLLTSRAEGEPLADAWRQRRMRAPLSTIDLYPLRDDEAYELAARIVHPTGAEPGGNDGLDIESIRECVERSEGNPLFLEQLLRATADGPAAGASAPVPGAVHSIVLARMDQLPPPDRSALQAASVLGQRVEIDAVRHLLGNPGYAPDELLERGLLRPDPEAGLLFSHALIRDAVYSSVLEEQRIAWHLAAATWIDEDGAGARDRVVAAEHLERAGSDEAAAAYLAAAKAHADTYRPEQALDLAHRGLALATDRTARVPLICLVGDEQRELGELDASITAFEEALELARGDADRSRAWLGLAAAYRVADRNQEALDLLDLAEPAARRAGLDAELTRIHSLRGNLCFPLGLLERCEQEHQRALELARRRGAYDDEARALSGLGDAAYLQGRFETSSRYFEACIALAREHGLGRIEVANLPMYGVSRLYHLEVDEAVALCEEAVEKAGAVGNRRAQMIAVSNFGEILAFSGDWDELDARSRRGASLAEGLGAQRFAASARVYVGLVRAGRGDREGSLPMLSKAVADCQATGAAFYGAVALGILALVDPDPVATNRHLDRAEALLAGRVVSHNYLFFYPFGMLACLDAKDWERAERYADELESYTSIEPLPWSELFAAWGRCLAAYGRGEGDIAELESVRARLEGKRFGLMSRPVERALARDEPSVAFRWPG